MKAYLTLTWLLLSYFVIFLNVLSLSAQSNRLAFLVGIDSFKDKTVNPIHGSNDVRLLEVVLTALYFQVDTLINQAATKAAFLGKWKNLVETAEAGSKVVILLSTHGQQIPDKYGAKINDEEDGWDEAFLLYDTPLCRTEQDCNTQGVAGYLLDDEIEVLLGELQQKVGETGQVLLLLDACHAGTGSRSQTISFIRGISRIPLATELQSKDKHIQERLNETLVLDNLVVISATQPDQVDVEYFDKERNSYFGPLVYLMANLLPKAYPNTTYVDLILQLQNEMSKITRQQQLWCEGGEKKEVFGGKYQQDAQVFSVIREGAHYYVLGNQFNLLQQGVELAFFEQKGMLDIVHQPPIARGKLSISERIGRNKLRK